MNAVITGSLVALAISVTAAAQDNTVKTQTKVSGDDAQAVTARGCLQTAAGNGFLLLGGITASGDELKSKSTVKTDVDDDKTTVKGRTTTKVDDGDRPVATAGAAAAYAVTPRSGVDLSSHAGQEVEINAVMIDARKGGDKDADITIKDKTTIDREDAPDSKVESKTKADVARGPLPQLMAISVKSLGRACSVQ